MICSSGMDLVNRARARPAGSGREIRNTELRECQATSFSPGISDAFCFDETCHFGWGTVLSSPRRHEQKLSSCFTKGAISSRRLRLWLFGGRKCWPKEWAIRKSYFYNNNSRQGLATARSKGHSASVSDAAAPEVQNVEDTHNSPSIFFSFFLSPCPQHPLPLVLLATMSDDKKNEDYTIELGEQKGNGAFDAAPSPRMPAAPQAAQLNSPVVAILAYCGSSILMTTTNKYVLSGLDFNLNFFLLAVQVSKPIHRVHQVPISNTPSRVSCVPSLSSHASPQASSPTETSTPPKQRNVRSKFHLLRQYQR